jgi:prolyl-tRNA editing enzyme YbaK/EbsC (Cys-tRNA(Pro) deacylase)
VPDTEDVAANAAIQRVLDAATRKGVSLDVRTFNESTHTADEAAAMVGVSLGQIVKSLVFVAPSGEGELEPFVCLVSGPNRVDVDRLAAVLSAPDIRRATAREAHELTGFPIGGIPPFGHQRTIRVVMDPDLGRFPVVWAAAGTPSAVFGVPPATLRSLANAPVAPITIDQRGEEAPAGPSAIVAAAEPAAEPATEPAPDAPADGGTPGDRTASNAGV